MKVEFTSLSSISETLSILRDNCSQDNIEIISLHEDTIPYLDYFIDSYKKLGCSV